MLAEEPRKRRRRRPGVLFFVGLGLCVLAAPLVLGGAYGYWLLHKTVGKIQRVPGLELTPEVPGQPVTYLVVGSDSRDAPQFAADREGPEAVSGQRADVIIAIVIDPRRTAAVVLSIPRDTRVEIPGLGLDKINASYTDGPQLVVQTVSNFIGLPVNHFIDVGFVGFMRLVDAVGNVPMCTEQTLKDDFTGLYLPAGCHDLNGGAALPLVRSRHTLVEINGDFVEDPTGDFGRILRQQQFLRSLFAKVAKPSNVAKFPTYIDAVSDTIRADGAFAEGDAVALGRRFLRADPNRLFMVSLPGAVADEIGGVSYVIPTDETTQFLGALRDGKPLPGEPGRPVAIADVRVTVRNGTLRAGCAQTIADILNGAGATISEVGAANRTDLAVTEIRYNPGDQPKADVVRGALGFGAVREFNHPGPEVEVLVGQDAARVCPE